jgi:hypothetical protein
MGNHVWIIKIALGEGNIKEYFGGSKEQNPRGWRQMAKWKGCVTLPCER